MRNTLTPPVAGLSTAQPFTVLHSEANTCLVVDCLHSQQYIYIYKIIKKIKLLRFPKQFPKLIFLSKITYPLIYNNASINLLVANNYDDRMIANNMYLCLIFKFDCACSVLIIRVNKVNTVGTCVYLMVCNT